MKRFRLIVGGLLIASIAAGATAYFAFLRETPHVPPVAPPNENEPAVATAVEAAREWVLKEPRSAQAWGDLGKVFLANGLEDESMICFTQAERLDPRDPRWPYYPGGILVNRGKPHEALPYLERAVALCEAAGEPNAAPDLLLGETLAALGQLEQAEGHYRAVLIDHPDEPRANLDLGLLLASRQDWDASRKCFLRCLGNPQAQQKATAQLAAVSLRLGDPAAAARYRAQADALPQDLEWADPFISEYLRFSVTKRNRYRLIEQLEAANRFREAANLVRPMTRDYPDDYLPFLKLGKDLGGAGDYPEAEQALRKALHLAPDRAQVPYYLSLVLYMQAKARPGEGTRAKLQEAAELAQKALAITADNGYAFMTLGLSLQALGHKERAIEALRQAVRCNPELAELHFYLGDALADAGQDVEARRHLEQALKLAPEQAAWRESASGRLNAIKQKMGERGPGKPNE